MEIKKAFCYLPKDIYIIFLGKLISSLGGFVYPIISLILIRKLQVDVIYIAAVMSIISLVQVPGSYLGGYLSDKYGRKIIICCSQFLGALLYVFCGFLNNKLLIILLIVNSFLFSISLPAYDSLITDKTDDSNRRVAFSFVYMGMNVGMILSPIISGFLFENYLSLIFILDAFTSFLSILIIAILLKDNFSTQDNKYNNKPDSSLFKIISKNKAIMYVCIIILLFQIAYSQITYSIPMQLNIIFNNNSSKVFGFLMTINSLIVIIFTPIIVLLTKKIPTLIIFSLTGVFYAISFIIIGYNKTMIASIIFIILFTMGEIMISTSMSPIIMSYTPISHRGRCNALVSISTRIGFLLGPILMGTLLRLSNFQVSWIFLIVLMVLGTIFSIYLFKSSKV